jgi:hypothetical protein
MKMDESLVCLPERCHCYIRQDRRVALRQGAFFVRKAIHPMRKISHAIPLRAVRRPRKAALLSGVLLLVFFVVLYGAAPERLPLLIQRLVGLTSGLLVMLFVTLSLGEIGQRYRHFGISSDRFTRLLNVVGWVAFALVLAWWFSRLAPIQAY